MYWLVDVEVESREELWRSEVDCLSFLNRASTLGARWEVRILGFRLVRDGAGFVVEGEREAVGHFMRLLQSGHGVWRYHHGGPIWWRPGRRIALGGRSVAWRQLDRIHGAGLHPLRDTWNSLRDHLGLRHAPWSPHPDPSAGRGPRAVWHAAGGAGEPPVPAPAETFLRPRVPWGLVDRAVLAATGMLPGHRRNQVARIQVAWHAGWNLGEIARIVGVSRATVRRTLLRERSRAVAPSLAILARPELRCSLASSLPTLAHRPWVSGPFDGGTPCRDPASSSNVHAA